MENAAIRKWVYKLQKNYQRELVDACDKIDFASNDYLGFAKEGRVQKIIERYGGELMWKGSTGSRLISGNRKWIEEIEKELASYHHTEDALIYSSAYQANVGLFSCIADKHDLVLIDEYVHASVYDGVRMSFAKHFKFKHNDYEHLKALINRYYSRFENIFVVTEGLFSMEGDCPDVDSLQGILDHKKIFLIVDEAHSFGVLGENRLGLFNEQSLAERCIARVIGYGKALGFSGAAVVGSSILKKYLINFSRAFIFTTALPLYHYSVILYLYKELRYHSNKVHNTLFQNIQKYLQYVQADDRFSKNNSPIQYFRIKNMDVERMQQFIYANHLFAKVILPPTVPSGMERVRLSLHSFNSEEEIEHLISTLQKL